MKSLKWIDKRSGISSKKEMIQYWNRQYWNSVVAEILKSPCIKKVSRTYFVSPMWRGSRPDLWRLQLFNICLSFFHFSPRSDLLSLAHFANGENIPLDWNSIIESAAAEMGGMIYLEFFYQFFFCNKILVQKKSDLTVRKRDPLLKTS